MRFGVEGLGLSVQCSVSSVYGLGFMDVVECWVFSVVCLVFSAECLAESGRQRERGCDLQDGGG